MRFSLLLLLVLFTQMQAIEFFTGLYYSEQNVEIYSYTPDQDYATFTSVGKLTPAIGMRTDEKSIRDSSFKYFFEFGGGFFEMGRQETLSSINREITISGGNNKDMGTSISGYYAYATPMLAYALAYKDISFRVGAGLGISYLDIHGDYIANRFNNEKYKVNASGGDISLGFMGEARLKQLSFYLEVFDASTEKNDIVYDFVRSNFGLRYYF